MLNCAVPNGLNARTWASEPEVLQSQLAFQVRAARTVLLRVHTAA